MFTGSEWRVQPSGYVVLVEETIAVGVVAVGVVGIGGAGTGAGGGIVILSYKFLTMEEIKLTCSPTVVRLTPPFGFVFCFFSRQSS